MILLLAKNTFPALSGEIPKSRNHTYLNPFTENVFQDGKSLETPKNFPHAAGYSLS